MLFIKDYSKIIDKPPIYQINLLKPTDQVYLSISYKAGYIFQNKSNSLAHILEHYLTTILVNQGIRNISALTSSEFIDFYFNLSRKEFLKYFEIILKTFYDLNTSHLDILEREKKNVYNEITEKCNDFKVRQRYLIDRELLSEDCFYISKLSFFQSDLISKVTLNDLTEFYKTYIQSSIPIMCLGGYRISKNEIQNLHKLISKFDWDKIQNQDISYFPYCSFRSNVVKVIKDTSLINGFYLILGFPILNADKMSIIQRKTVRILLEDIHSHSSQYSLNANLRRAGVYKSDIDIYFYQSFGYFFYTIFGNYGQESTIVEIFKQTIEFWKNSEILVPIISESIRDVVSRRKKQNNEDRFYKFSDILTEGDIPLNDNLYIKKLKSLSSNFWQNLIETLFNWNKMSILIIHNGSQHLNLEEIANIFSLESGK